MFCARFFSLLIICIFVATKNCEGVDGPSGLIGNSECTSTTCEDANCAAVDDWYLFGQTCTILANHQKKTCCKHNRILIYAY